MAKLTVKGEVDYVDLRKVTARGSFLNKIMKKFKLEHLDCVVFTNNDRYKPRFRLVTNIHDQAFLSIPTIDEDGKYSLYLRVSEYLASFAKLSSTRIELKKIAEDMSARIARQKARAKQAKNGRGN